jgi:hypothetical protein
MRSGEGPRDTRGPGSQFYTPVFVFSMSVSSLTVVVVAVSADSGVGVGREGCRSTRPGEYTLLSITPKPSLQRHDRGYISGTRTFDFISCDLTVAGKIP